MGEVAPMAKKPKILEKMGERFGIEPNKMVDTLKATAFRTREPITNEQMLALCVVADQYSLNPWTKEIYAFPDKHGGIVPVIGIDGWSRIINNNPQFDGMEFEYSDDLIQSEEHKPCPSWVRCKLYRKDRSHAVAVEEYLDECYRPPFNGRNGVVVGPWQTHTKRFLRHKSMIQCARIAFGFVGIYDEDEAERIVEGETIRAAGPEPGKRSPSVAATVVDEEKITVDEAKCAEYVEVLKECVFEQDDFGIRELYEEMDHHMQIVVHRKLNSTDRAYIKEATKEQDIEPATIEQ